ncbi:MAG: [protein-PII] uridylyltransferase [candidate division NC10 bacterium]|nr:[protein-PII] uridylyltransferase [candidate division NC10 bacterium]
MTLLITAAAETEGRATAWGEELAAALAPLWARGGADLLGAPEGPGAPARHRQALVHAVRAFVEERREGIRRRHRAGAAGLTTVADLTALTDALLTTLYRSAEAAAAAPFGERAAPAACALVALGGYGRRELCPASDVDILFLYQGEVGRTMHALVHFLLHLLWDVGFTVGHSVRTLRDCRKMAEEDLRSRTSMMEARFLAGEAALVEGLGKVVGGAMARRKAQEYIRAKLAEQAARHEKHGGSLYLQEPQIKEGVGGLRDVHTALWVAAAAHPVRDLEDLATWGMLDREEVAGYRAAIDFLLRARVELHYLSETRSDVLLFPLQVPAAAHLGFTDDGAARGVERFMQTYYLHARTVQQVSARIVDRCTGTPSRVGARIRQLMGRDLGDGFTEIGREIHILPRHQELFAEDPVRLLKAFWYAQQTGFALSQGARDLIRGNLDRIDDAVRRSNRALGCFLAILRERTGVARILRQMHETGVLGAYIPEWGKLTCLVQHDLYHKYTVDVHTLLALEYLEQLDRAETTHAEEFQAIAAQLPRPEVLKLAVLLHDIGKGEGHGHVVAGRRLTVQILERMGLAPEEIAEVEFLVANHLVMAHLSQRRDLSDERMVLEFARQVKTIPLLQMLYLLTYLDIRAVGPDVWTEWKGALLWELYLKTHTILTRGIAEGVDDAARAAEVGTALLAELTAEFAPAAVRAHLDKAPVRYLLTTTAPRVAQHLRLIQRLEAGAEAAVQWAAYPMAGHAEVVVCAYGRPGRFARIVGTLTANGMNILSAAISTLADGLVIRQFQVDDGRGMAIGDPTAWTRFEADLDRVLRGVADVRELILARRRDVLRRPAYKGRTPPPTRVEFDNVVSETHTVLDVRTADRLGLLYVISSVLTELGLDLSLAKITTEADQAVDVFYVTEAGGSKVPEGPRMEEIRRRLTEAISEGIG